jgi:hypothetical protein
MQANNGADVVPYSKTATSDAVLYFAGTIVGQGILATTSVPFCAIISKALLKPPSIFSTLVTGEEAEETEGRDETRLHNASRSNLTWRFDNWDFSLTRNRPFVYSKSSRWIGSPVMR